MGRGAAPKLFHQTGQGFRTCSCSKCGSTNPKWAEEAIWTVAAPVNWPFALSKPGISIKPPHGWVPSWVVFAAAGDQHGIYQRGISCDLFIPRLINSVSSMCLVKSSMCVLLVGSDPAQLSGGWIKYPLSLIDLSCTQGGHKYLCALKSMWDLSVPCSGNCLHCS